MYITFEGPEACGKSTQAKLLHDKLTEMKLEALLTKEPGSPHSDLCTTFRSLIFKEEIVEEAALFCFLADRSQHVRTVISPALKSNKIVISDRSSLSTIIYHIAKQCPDPIDWEYVTNLLPVLDIAQHIKPDLCFVATADYDWTIKQLGARSGLDRIEQRGKTFHSHIHSLFHKLGTQNSAFDLGAILAAGMKFYPKRIIYLPMANEASVEQIHDFILTTIQNIMRDSQ